MEIFNKRFEKTTIELEIDSVLRIKITEGDFKTKTSSYTVLDEIVKRTYGNFVIRITETRIFHST